MGWSRRSFLYTSSGALGAVVFGVRVPWTPAAVPGRPSVRWRFSDTFLDGLPALLSKHGVHAASFALGGPEMPVAAHAAGRREASGRRAIDVAPDGIFAAASLSKPVVATIAWTLQRAGDFDVDRPLSEYLSDDVPTGRWAGSITSRHALQHASGLPNWRFEPGPLETTFEPGTAWRYSGEGYVLVQRALEAASGQALERLARDVVFGPLGMASSSFLARPDLAARFVAPYVAPDERFGEYAALLAWKERALIAWARDTGVDPADVTQDRLRDIDAEIVALAKEMADRPLPDAATVPNFLSPNGAGSLRTTARDYLLLLRHWLADDELRRRAFAAPAMRDDGIAWGAGWGLDGADRQAFWHWGETLGVRTLAYADAEVGDALVVLTNGSGGMPVAREAFRAATGRESAALDSLG